MKRARRIFLVITAVLLIAMVWLVSTEGGLRLLARSVDNMTSGAVRIAAASGKLLGPFHLEGITITVRDTRVTLGRVDVSAIHAHLSGQAWRIDTVHVSDLRIYPPPHNDKRPPVHLSPLRAPVQLDIGHARLDGLTVITEKGTYSILSFAEGPLTWHDHRLDFDKLITQFPQVQSSTTGTIEFRDHWLLTAAATWRWNIPSMQAWTGTVSLRGDFMKATAIGQIEAPFRAKLNGHAQDLTSGVRWRVNGTLSPQSLKRLNPAWPDWFLTGVLDASGKLADYGVRGNVLTISDNFVTRTNIETRWQGARARITRAITHSPGYSGEARTSGEIDFAGHPMRFKLDTTWKGIAWPIATQWLHSNEGYVRLAGTLNNYHVQLQGKATLEKLPTISLTANGAGDAQQLHFSEVELHTLDDTARLQGTAQLRWQTRPAFDIGLHILRIAWPQDREPILIAHNGILRLFGQADDYQVSLQTALEGPPWPQSQFELYAHGDRTGVEADRAILNILGGAIAAHGKVAFSPSLTWQIAARGANINPQALDPQWPGSLDFMLTANNSPSLLAEVNLQELNGTLRRQRLIGTAHVEMTTQRDIYISPALLRLGDGYVLVEGDAGTHWALSWAASLPDLANLNNELSGSLSSGGSLSGEWSRLRVGGTAHARGIVWRDQLRIGEAQADIDADLSAQDPSHLNLAAKNVILRGTSIELITLNGHGTGSEHNLDLVVQTTEDQATLNAAGTLRRNEWELTLKNGQLASATIGNWHSTAAARWIIATNEQRLEPWCWSEDNASLCVSGSWHDIIGWHGEINGSQIPLRVFRRWLPPDVTTTGGINISARVDQSTSGSLSGRARLISDRGLIRFQLAPQETTELAYRRAAIDVMSSGRNIATRLNIDFPNAGFIQGNVGIVNAFGPTTQSMLSGELRAAINRLDFIPALLPDVAEPQGELKGVMRVSGSLSQPSLTVHAELKGEARLPRPRLYLRNIVGRITGSTSNGVAYTVSAQSGPGSLKAAGHIDAFGTETWHTQIGITGTRFQIVDVPEATALISPDLALDISPQSIRVDGTIGIPEARLNVQRLENAITPSHDVIIAGEVSNGTTPVLPPLSSLVRVELGEQIQVEGFGLKARLQGSLALIDEPNQPTHGVGQIMIAEGSYNLEKLYGAFAGLAEKEITINRGRLIFPNIPLTDPPLDVRASRVIGEVTAGVTVRGTLQHPQITPFSVPTMSHSDALSYLLYGLPLSQASTEEGQALYYIASSAAASGSALLANQVIRILGLPFDSARVENDPATGASFVVVGKYLSPRLYISYGRGLAEQLNTFRLRYQLSSKWAIEADTSNDQQSGADIVYTLESGE